MLPESVHVRDVVFPADRQPKDQISHHKSPWVWESGATLFREKGWLRA
jgi:hypothetical protein